MSSSVASPAPNAIGRYGRKVFFESEAFRVIENVFRSECIHHFDGGNVARLFERVAQRDRPEKLVIVILWTVNLSIARRIGDRRVDQNRCRREAAVDRRRVDDRLEGGTELAVGLNRAIELAAGKAPAADHRLDLTGSVIDRQQRRFGQRRLLQRHRQRAGVLELRDRHLDQVARLEQVGSGRAARPGIAFAP